MGLMSYIHRQLLRRGKLEDLLPEEEYPRSGDRSDLEIARADTEARLVEEQAIKGEVATAVWRLKELDRKNHYGESLRRAFGGH